MHIQLDPLTEGRLRESLGGKPGYFKIFYDTEDCGCNGMLVIRIVDEPSPTDIRFQEADTATPLVLSDGVTPNAGAGYGPPASGPDPQVVLDSYDRSAGNVKLNDTTGMPKADTTWVVDDDGVQCPTANFTSIQTAVNYAAPWDTIVVCAGTYLESSTPVNSNGNPVGTGSKNGLTINKSLKIKGAGADKVTIKPDPALGI